MDGGVAWGQINYTTGNANWTNAWSDNSSKFDVSSPFDFGQASWGSDTNQGQVDGRKLTTDGTLNGTELSLQVGQVLLLNMGGRTGGGRDGIANNGRIGMTLGSGSNLFTGNNGLERATNDARLRIDFLGGGNNARIIGGETLSGSNFNDFKNGRYYAVELLSKDQVLIRYGSNSNANDVVFNILDLAGTPGSDIGRIMVYNLGANMDSLFGQIVVSDTSFLNYFNGDTTSTRTISGLVTNNQSTTNHIEKSGAGIVHITRTDNTLTGSTTIKAGTLRIDGDGSLGIAPTTPTAGKIVIENGVFDLNGNFDIQEHRGITLSHASSTVSVGNSFDAGISGTITGTGGLTKTGSGTLTLTGTNSYSGATVVDQGSLVVGVDSIGSIASDVTVAGGAMLKGTGTITGAVSIEDSGTHAPGNSIGIQNVSGNVTYNPSSIFEWEMNYAAGNEGARGTNYDAVNVGGNVNGNNSVFRIVLPGSGTFADTFWNANRTWSNIFTGSNGTTPVSNWAGVFSALTYFNAGGGISEPDALTQGSFTLSGNSLSWQSAYSAIPEPGSALAGLLLAAGMLRRRR
jgi:autotransporter-associated beta strand protein